MTQFERIKNMTIDEMSEFLGDEISGCMRHTEVCEVNEDCEHCFLNYLKSEECI